MPPSEYFWFNVHVLKIALWKAGSRQMNRLEVCKKLADQNLLCSFNAVLSQSFILYRGPLNQRSISKNLGNITHVLISCGASEYKLYILNLAQKYEYEEEKMIEEILIFNAKRIIPK